MSLDLRQLDSACTDCIKSYKGKHKAEELKGKFHVACTGIPKEHSKLHLPLIQDGIKKDAPNLSLSPEVLLDPVRWAGEVLDWHCIDPDGAIWKRKTREGTLGDVHPYIEPEGLIKALDGKSPYHRPYQKIMLTCTSNRKVFRTGRQIGKSEILVISMLYNLFTHEDYRIIVIAPYQSQVELLFRKLEHMISKAPSISNSVRRSVKAPNYTLELYNGSLARMFTAGTKSGGNADAARGQRGDMLILEEADYLSAGDITSALAIITNQPNASVLVSSTPTGKRERFWSFCMSPNWKEFYHPSHVNPNFTPELDAFYKETLLGTYNQEICLAKNTQIKTLVGDKPIQDIGLDDLLYDHHGRLIQVVRAATKTGQKEVICASLCNEEFSIIATSDHKFPDRTFSKKPLAELEELPVYRHKAYSRSSREIVLARLVGYNLGDGTSTSTRFMSCFYSSHKEDMGKLRSDIKYLWPSYKGRVLSDLVKGKPNGLVKVDGERHSVNVSKKITEELLKYGIIRGKKVEKEFRVPSFVREGTEAGKIEFLAALFGAEGGTPGECSSLIPHTISLSMSKRAGVNGSDFFDDLKHMLEELSIRCTWTSSLTWTPSSKEKNTTYTLYIYNQIENIRQFFLKIGYRYAQIKEDLAFAWFCYLGCWKAALAKKQAAFIEARRLRANGETYKSISQATDLSYPQIDKAVNRKDVPARLYRTYPHFSQWLGQHFVEGAIFLPLKKTSLKGRPARDVYNLTVDSPDHSYLLANGIRTFNCALFGEQSEGVYQASFVNAAQLDYEYKFMVREPDWTYCIGVDWNDVKVGTTIVVVGWNPKDEMFYIVDRKTVSREGWTLTEACQQIVNLNKVWRPAWIYVDRGYGAMQIEQLHKFGLDARADPKRGPAHPDAAIASIAVAYDFASKIDIKDPFTGQPASKSAKPFLVENSMRRFEQGRIRYPSSDKQLTSELLGYIIERVTPSGIPVYKQGNERVGDHTLDALNLALIAFTLQISDFCKPKYETRITFTGKLGDPTERQLKEIVPGLILKPEKGPTTYWDQIKAHRPDSNRGVELDQASRALIGPENRTPAANTRSLAGGPKLWSWPGFLRDEPPPVKRSVQPGLTGSRPKRKTF